MAKAKLIDITKCSGCRSCQVACKQWNGLPAEVEAFTGSYQTHADLLGNTFTIVKFLERISPGPSPNQGKLEWLFRKHGCFHCQGTADCVAVCSKGALYYTDQGTVWRDYAKCAACGKCIRACPYGIIKWQAQPGGGKDKPSQCKFCYDRVSNALSTACAKACTTGAISFGERVDMLAAGNARVLELQGLGYTAANLYGDAENGGGLVLLVLPYAPADFGLPSNP